MIKLITEKNELILKSGVNFSAIEINITEKVNIKRNTDRYIIAKSDTKIIILNLNKEEENTEYKSLFKFTGKLTIVNAFIYLRFSNIKTPLRFENRKRQTYVNIATSWDLLDKDWQEYDEDHSNYRININKSDKDRDDMGRITTITDKTRKIDG